MITPSGPTLLGFDVIWVATVLSAVATFAVLVRDLCRDHGPDPMARRVKALNERREQLKAGIVASTNKRKKLTNKNEAADKVRGILAQLQDAPGRPGQEDPEEADAGRHPHQGTGLLRHLRALRPADRARHRRGRADLRRRLLPRLGRVQALMPSSPARWSLGYKAPDICLKNKVKKRTDAIRKGLPDALDLLVICAEAGLTVDAAFNRVAKELGKAYPELGDEFALTAIELGFLTERRQAFENLAYRVDLDAVRGVVTTMIQTEKYGTPLASALRVLSAEFRNERMMRAEEKAARLPAIMTVPLILFILPVLFIVILGPAACSISDSFING